MQNTDKINEGIISAGTFGDMVQIGEAEVYLDGGELLPLQPDEIPEQESGQDELAELRAEFEHFQQTRSDDDEQHHQITLSGAAYAERAGAAWRW